MIFIGRKGSTKLTKIMLHLQRVGNALDPLKYILFVSDYQKRIKDCQYAAASFLRRAHPGPFDKDSTRK